MVRMAPLNMKESNYEPGFKLMARSPSDYVLRQRCSTRLREQSTWVYDTDLQEFIGGPFRSHALATRTLTRMQEEFTGMPDIPGLDEPHPNELTIEQWRNLTRLNPCGEINLEEVRPRGPRLSVADRETLRHRVPIGENLIRTDLGRIERRILARMQVDENTAAMSLPYDHGLEEGDQAEVNETMFTVTGRIAGMVGGSVNVNLHRTEPNKIKPPAWTIKGVQERDGKPGRWFVLRHAQKFAGPFPARDIAAIAMKHLRNIIDSPYMAVLTNKRAMNVDNDKDKNLKSRICDLENTLAKVMDVVQGHGQITGKGKGGNKHKRMRVSFKLDHLEEVLRILKGKKTDEVYKKAGRDSSGGHADRRRRDVRVFDADRSASSSV